MTNKLVSVIIPIYNAENYFNKCIDSVLCQSYRNLEIILINDGSTDNSLDLCVNYANKDNRIKVIDKSNSGPSITRKYGLELSTGEFIIFVDADDYIDKDMIEILMNKATNGFDIVECGYREVTVDSKLIREVELNENEIIGYNNSSLAYASQRNTTNFLWNKIYRRKILSDLNFPNLFAGEDSCILTQVYSRANKISRIKNILYNYVLTPDSLCRQPFSIKKLDNIKAGEFMYNFYAENNPRLKGFSAFHICSYAAQMYCKISLEKYDNSSLTELVESFEKYYPETRDLFVRKMISKKRILFVDLFKKSKLLAKLSYSYILK